MRKYSLLFVTTVFLTGCDTTEKIKERFVGPDGNVPVVVSVAEKALGPEAYFVDPFVRSEITTPGIWAVRKSGRYIKLCENDFNKQNALVEMANASTTTSVPEVIEDSLSEVRIKVKVLGDPYELPYRKLRVSGYKIIRAPSLSSQSAEQYILDNVYKNCPEVLEENRPYFIVTQIAIAKKVETLSGGGIADVSFEVPFPVKGVSPEVEVKLRDHSPKSASDKVFGMLGRFVKIDP